MVEERKNNVKLVIKQVRGGPGRGPGLPRHPRMSPCRRGASQCDSRFLSASGHREGPPSVTAGSSLPVDTEADPGESSLGGGLRLLGLPGAPDALTWRASANRLPHHFFSTCFTPASSRSASRQPCKAGTGGPSTAEGGEARGGCRLANGTLLPRAFEFKLPFYQGEPGRRGGRGGRGWPKVTPG